MITWAALLVLQGVEGGVGEPDGTLCSVFLSPILPHPRFPIVIFHYLLLWPLFSSLPSLFTLHLHTITLTLPTTDFILIQSHLNMLQYTHQPSPSLRHRLASRLEASLQNMHTPRPPPELEHEQGILGLSNTSGMHGRTGIDSVGESGGGGEDGGNDWAIFD